MAAVEEPPSAADSVGENFLKVIVEPGITKTEIDIVAVHGLNPGNSPYHAENTWTKGSTLWLRDLLPSRLPMARIMLFGYNANVAFESSTAGVLEQAHNLLNWLRLRRRREKAENRPIIFIAHSLGGIVVKRALVVASQVERYKPIRSSTFGMVFFATPHRGGEFVPLGKIAAKIVRAVYATPKNSFLESLEKDNLFTSTMIDDFRSMLEDFQVISFFETRPMPHVGIVVDQKSAVLGLSHNRETHLALNLDHRHICKFDRETAEYELVEENIMEMVEEAIIREEKRRGEAEDMPVGEVAQPLSDDAVKSQLLLQASPDPSISSQFSPRMLLQDSPNPQMSPQLSMPGSPDPAALPALSSRDEFVAPDTLSRSSTTFSQSIQSLALSDDNEAERRRSSSTAATRPSVRSEASSESKQVKSPGLFRSMAMNISDSEGSTFRKAAATGQKDTVKRMLENGIAIDNSGVGHGFTALAEASLNGHQDIVKLLLEEGSNPAFNCVSTFKQFGSIENTPLALAAGKGHLGCMKILLDAHQYTVEELNRAFRAAKYRNRTDAIKLIQERGGGLY